MRAHSGVGLNADSFKPLSYFPLSPPSWIEEMQGVVETTHTWSRSTTRSCAVVTRVPAPTASMTSIAVRETRAPISRSIT